jgi:hypothetical protein
MKAARPPGNGERAKGRFASRVLCTLVTGTTK